MKRIGVIGSGSIVRSVHLPVLLGISDVQVRWIADVNSINGRETAAAFRLPFIHLVESSRLSLEDVDIALLATPVFARTEYLEQCGRAGTAVLAEKPFALSVQQHKSFLSLSNAENYYCGYMRRTYASYRALRELILGGYFGELNHIRYAEGGRVRGSETLSPTLDLPYDQGGGVLRDLGCHGLDTILFITGAQQFKNVKASLEWDRLTDRHVEAHFDVVAASGVSCSVDYTVSWLFPQCNEIALSFDHAELRATIGHEGRMQIARSHGVETWSALKIDAHGASTAFQAFHLEWRQVLDSVSDNVACDLKAKDLVATTALVDAIYFAGSRPH